MSIIMFPESTFLNHQIDVSTLASVLNTNIKQEGWFFMKMSRVWRVHAS